MAQIYNVQLGITPPMEEKGGYIALETPYETGAGASGMKTNKQTNIHTPWGPEFYVKI